MLFKKNSEAQAAQEASIFLQQKVENLSVQLSECEEIGKIQKQLAEKAMQEAEKRKELAESQKKE